MPNVVLSEEPQSAWAPPAAKPLDEAVWQAWLAKGRAQERRNSVARMKVMKCALIAALLGAAGYWFNLVGSRSW